jgi:hypothetical protein
MVKVPPGMLFNPPATWVVEAPAVAEVRTGKLRRSFGPVSGSEPSLAVTPRRGGLSQERIELLNSWRRSGFSVHNRVFVHPREGREFEALVRYMMRPPVSPRGRRERTRSSKRGDSIEERRRSLRRRLEERRLGRGQRLRERKFPPGRSAQPRAPPGLPNRKYPYAATKPM